MATNGVFYNQTKGLVISTDGINRVFVQTGGTTTFTGITSGNTIVEVQGVSGQVMRVTDCTNGVLFSSNNISGQAILQTNSCGSIIGGIGSSSTANATTIGGGNNNSTTANFSTIGGGCCNTSSGCFSTIGGGQNNTSSGTYSIVGGGQFNTNTNSYSTIGGGRYNTNTGTHSTIGGGRNNTNCGDDVTIGGGRSNYVSSAYNNYSTIGGGLTNCVLDNSCFSFIGGGRNNTITTSSYCSGILGGGYNTINSHTNSFIIGCGITTTTSNYSFMNNLCVFGNVTKGGGSFKISHPNPDKNKTHYLIHSFVESPTAGDNIYRYEVESINGVAEITLPDYFSYLNENIQVWVSGKNNFGNGYGEVSNDLKKINIHTSIDGIYNVLVIGTRKDDHAKKYWKGTEEEKNIK